MDMADVNLPDTVTLGVSQNSGGFMPITIPTTNLGNEIRGLREFRYLEIPKKHHGEPYIHVLCNAIAEYFRHVEGAGYELI